MAGEIGSATFFLKKDVAILEDVDRLTVFFDKEDNGEAAVFLEDVRGSPFFLDREDTGETAVFLESVRGVATFLDKEDTGEAAILLEDVRGTAVFLDKEDVGVAAIFLCGRDGGGGGWGFVERGVSWASTDLFRDASLSALDS